MAIACLFALLFGIAALVSQIGERRIESCIPISICLIIVIMYVFGLAGQLQNGVWTVLFCGTAAGFFSILKAIVQKRFAKMVAGLFTPAMVIYYLLCMMVFVANYAKPVKTWDEFTYWADAVKIMTQLKVLPTESIARSLFASYPPALPLWQYLLQEINCILAGKMIYAEPLLFMSYQWFLLALYIPFLQKLTWRKPIEIILCVGLVPLIALAVFPQAFNQLHSDVLLGTLGGFVCAQGFYDKKATWFDIASQTITLFVLVLVKDAGILFALAGVCVVAFACNTPSGKKRLFAAVASLCAVAVARISWSICVNYAGAKAQATFDDPVRLAILLDPAQSWRITTLRNYIYQFFELIFPVQGTNVNISYFLTFVVLGAGCYAIYSSLPEPKGKRHFGRLCMIVLVTTIVYIIGTGLTYVFKFYEDEAVRMASYTRYLNILVMFCAFVLFAAVVHQYFRREQSVRMTACVLIIFMVFAPCTKLLNAVSRLDAQAAYQSQEEFLALEQKVFDVAEENDRIYIIAAGSGGFEQVVMRYRLRPLFVGDDPWNIGVEIEEDRFSARRTPQEFRQTLLDGYELVVICSLTEEFIQTYAELFENPDTLAVGQIYRVNKDTGMLQTIS